MDEANGEVKKKEKKHRNEGRGGENTKIKRAEGVVETGWFHRKPFKASSHEQIIPIAKATTTK